MFISVTFVCFSSVLCVILTSLLLLLQSLITSGCVEHLDFLDKIGDPSDIFVPFEEKTVGSSFKSLTEIPKLPELNDVALRYNEQVRNWTLIYTK